MNIMNYDPNLTNSGRMADQLVKLTFAQWEYRVEMTATVGGNCTGLDVLRSAVGNVFDKLPYRTIGTHEITEIVLTNAAGDTLSCEDEDEKGEAWLADMLIKAEIVEIKSQQEEIDKDSIAHDAQDIALVESRRDEPSTPL